MTEHDENVASLLERMVPREAEARDWDGLLWEALARREPSSNWAQRRSLRKRLVVVVALVALAVLLPLAAFAVGQRWWFLSVYTPKPVDSVNVIDSGRWSGIRWTLSGFRTDKATLCYALTASTATPISAGGSEACTPLGDSAGISFLRNVGTAGQRTRLNGGGRTAMPGYIIGTAPASASEVEVVAPDGSLQRVTTVAPPGGLHVPVRFFVAMRAASQDVERLNARDSAGAVIARTEVGSPRHMTYRLASPGKALGLTSAAIHQLRLHHRSPQIYLLATRNGQNIYRLGAGGRCFGVGPAANMRWNPPALALRMLGMITCGQSGSFPSASRPILDLSVYGQTKGQKLMTVYRLAGIASDRVAAVELVNADGLVVKRVPIVNGVFTLARVPGGVVAFAPIGRDGVWLRSCGYGKGSLPIICG
jgi:hypothetical protein